MATENWWDEAEDLGDASAFTNATTSADAGVDTSWLDEAEDLGPVEAAPARRPSLISTEAPTLESLGVELPKPPPPPESILRQAADIPVQFAIGVNNSIKGLTDLFGADNPVSQNLSQNVDWYRSILSASAKEDEAEVARIMEAAENEGIGGQLMAGLKAFTVAPVDFISSGLGSLATFAIGGAAARAAGLGMRGIQAVQAGMGAGMGAGIAKGEIYQSVKDEMISQGKTEEEARKVAMEAQSFNGKNLDQILLAAGLGAASAYTGAESIISKILTKGGIAPTASRIGNVLKGGLTEGVPEFAQAAQEAVASNLALQREGVDVPLTQGVFARGALEGLAGVALGAGAGAIEPRVAPPTTQEVNAAASETKDVARQNMDVAPATASLVERQAETFSVNATVTPRREGETDQEWRARTERERAETPEQRVTRLQEEARAAAGIELEEEGEVGVEPTVPVTPPEEPAPEGAVAPVEPVVPVEGAVEPVTPEVAPKAENAVVEAEQKSEQESDTVKVFRGVAEAGALPTGGAFFTDSERDASAYAQLAALRKAIDDNPEIEDIVGEVMSEQGAEDLTDLSIQTVKDIIEVNNIKVGDISEGVVLRGNIRLGNVLNLESFGSEVGKLSETWNQLNELGLVPEIWQSLDEDVQAELQDKYRGKAFYYLLEGEVNLNDQFAKGIDTIVFTDQNTEGRGTHRTYLTKAAEQFAQEAVPAAVEPTPVTPPVTPERIYEAKKTTTRPTGTLETAAQILYEDQARLQEEPTGAGEIANIPRGEQENQRVADFKRERDESRIKAENSVREAIRLGRGRFTDLSGVSYLVTPSSDPDVLVRITRVSQDGTPLGHTDFSSDSEIEDYLKGVARDTIIKAAFEQDRPDLASGWRFASVVGRRDVKFRYRLKLRPATIGTQPNGATIVGEREVEYDRPLTSQELIDFEMEPVGATEVAEPQPAAEVAPAEPVAPVPAERPKLTPEERKAKLDRLKEIRDEVLAMPFQQVGGAAELSGLTTEQAQKYSSLMMEAEGIRFDIRRELDVNKIPSEQERDSAVPANIVKIASDELVTDRGVFDAIAEAAAGTFFGQDTAVDRVMSGENPNITPNQFYNTFNKTREALREKFGDTIKLYRAVGKQKEKPTQNWHSTRKGASQYGRNIVERDVPIDDIVALNVGSTGRYEEFIVGKKPAPAVTPPAEVAPEMTPTPEVRDQQQYNRLRSQIQQYNERTQRIARSIQSPEYGTTTEQRIKSLHSFRSALVGRYVAAMEKRGITVEEISQDEAVSEAGLRPSVAWVDANGRVGITFGNQELRNIAEQTSDGNGARSAVVQSVEEEIIHAIHNQYMLRDWDGRGNAEEYLRVQAGSGLSAAFKELGMKRATEVFGASWRAYFKQDMASNEQMVDAIVKNPINALSVWGESVRQLVELRENGEIGESTFRRVVNSFNDFFRQIVESVTQFFASPEYRGTSLKNDVDAIANTFREVIGQTEVRESRREPAPLTQQDREYLDAVDRDDMETAQRIVDEVAKTALRKESTDSVFDRHKDFKMMGLTLEEIAQNPEALREEDQDDYNSIMYWVSQIQQGKTPTVVADNKGILWDGYHRLLASKIANSKFINVFKSAASKTTDEITKTIVRGGFFGEGDIIPLSQRFQPEQADIRYSYAGVRAQTPQFMRDSLSVAQAMAAKGEDAEAIRSVTGWIVNPYDGKLRWEIPDNNVSFTKNIDSTKPYLTLGEVLNHDAFFEAYPDAKNILFQKVLLKNNIGAYFDPQRNKITLNSSMSNTKQLSSTLHEIQHWIQKREGFAQGSSPEEFIYDESFQLSEDSQKKVDELELEKTKLRKEESELNDYFRSLDDSQKGFGKNVKEARRLDEISYKIRDINDAISKIITPEKSRFALEKYVRTAGEIESRDVQARMKMTPEQRKATAPYSSENISPEDAVIMGGEGGVAELRGRRVQMGRAGMETSAVEARLQELGFPTGGIIRVVNEPDADFEGRTIILDGKVVGIELNAAALKDDAAVERVLNHEIAESANADGALNRLVAGLTPKERKEINDTITRLGYEERARTSEEAARAIETLAEAWKGRGFFTRAVARVEAWASKLGFKLTRRAAEYIAARNLADINSGFRTAYNRFINVRGEAREGRAFVTPEENARFLELAQNPEANREELQKMVDKAAQAAGYTREAWQGAAVDLGPVYKLGLRNPNIQRREQELNNFGFFFTFDKDTASKYIREGGELRRLRVKGNLLDLTSVEAFDQNAAAEEMERLGISIIGITRATKKQVWSLFKDYGEVLRKRLQDAGYDGVLFNEEYRDGSVHVTGAVFESNQLKLADPVTRDDQGNIIPLSERFQPTEADIRYSIRESRREDAIPTFSEGSPEASTLSTMASSMAKVDAASEAKPNPENKPTYKISEIASVWMDQGGDARQLQDLITENTLLTPANAKKVANAIAKQYGLQQSIAEARVETAEGVSLEGLPEGVSIPKEADPKRPKTVIQRLIDVTTGVRVPPVKITATERSLLNNQIRMRAAANREAKKAQQETANEVVEIIKAMELRGPVRPKQVQALAKRAAKVIWTSEKSMESFMAYAEKVVANANYDADLREAKAAQKRAAELSKRKTIASPQREILANVAKIGVNMLDNPREFAEVVNYYMRGFKPVASPDYLVVPDDEMTSYLSQAEDIVEEAKVAFDRVVTQRLSEKYGVSPDKIQEILNAQDIERALVQYAKRDVAEAILNEKANEVLAGLKAYDQTGLRADQRKIIDSILKLDPSLLSSQEKQQFVRTGNNIILNNQTHGAELFAVTAKGQQMAREAASNEDLIAKNKAWVNILPSLRSRTLQKTWRNWALELQSVADTFRNAFGKGAMAKVYRMMGMYELDRGFTAAANTVNQIQEEIAAFYNNLEKKYKAAARNQDGILAEGIVGFLIQKVPEKGEVESLAQRRNLIQQDIRNRRISQDADRIDMADRIERILQQLDGESVSDIMANLKRDYRANYESVTWLKDTLFPKYKEFLKRFDENFNDQANNYENPDYLPIGFIRAGVSLAITPENEALYYEHVSLRPKQSSYTIKRADYTELPTDKTTNKPKEIEFNLRRNAFDSLSDQINKAYTNPAWQQIFAFMKTPESEKLFGGAANKEFFIERLNRLRLSRMRRGSMSSGYIEKTADVLSVFARKIGTGIALGGAYQPFKQAPDQIIAAIGTTGRADLMAENMAPSALKAAKVLLDKFSIGRRGDASSGYKYINQMEGAQNKIERYLSESRWDAAKEQAGKISDVWLLALKKTDYVFAAGAWMTYYRAQLAKDKVAFQGWEKEAELLETDTARQDAASYAEQMTDIYQGSSDPTKMATFVQSGKSGWENLFKAVFVPFNSFAVQQRMRIYSDARDSFTKSGEDAAIGRFGLAATIGGLVAFHSVRRFALPALTGVGVSMLYAAFGVDMDEPDEEKKAEDFAKRWRQFLGEFTANLLVGGSGQIVEAATIDSFNYAAYLIAVQTEHETVLGDDGEVIPFSRYAKERSPFWRYRSFDNAMSLGMFDIGLDQGKKSILETKTLMTPEEMENFTNEEQSLLYFAALSDWLYLMRLNDADFARMVDRARREVKAKAKETEKELARIRAGR